MRRLVAVALASVAIFAAPLARSQADPLQEDRAAGASGMALDSLLTRFGEYGFSGAVLAARDSQVMLSKGYGWADVERKIPNTAATRFEMNSMTKMFTGVAILQLEAAGRLRATDPLERFFGQFPAEKRGATIEQLASHTAGLVVSGAELADESRDAFVRDIIRTPRESLPGAQYRYTNAGFSLLAALIEQVSGQPYEEYLRRQLFAPAGMTSATFRDEVRIDDARFSHGYVGTPAALQRGPTNPYVWGTRGAGGVWLTVGDVFRWVGAIESGTVLRDPQRTRLFASPALPALEAYGWQVEREPGGRVRIQKGGGSDDFASQMLYYPDDKVLVVWASNNLRQRWRRTLNRAIPNAIFGETAVSLPAVARIEPAALAVRAARYFTTQEFLDVRAGDGYLYVLANQLGVPANVMFYCSGDEVFTGFDPATGEQTRLRFGGDGTLTVELAGGGRVSLSRLR